MNIYIRTLTKNDIKNVQEVVTLSWRDTYKQIIPLDIQKRFLNVTYSEDALIERIHNSHFFIAEKDNQIVGVANFSLLDDSGQVELGALYLHPDFKRQGIGKQLFHKALDEIEGVKEVLVHVEKHNKEALAFYNKMGFTYVKEVHEYFYGYPLHSIQLILYRF